MGNKESKESKESTQQQQSNNPEKNNEEVKSKKRKYSFEEEEEKPKPIIKQEKKLFEFEQIEISGEHYVNEYQSFAAFEANNGELYLVTSNNSYELQLINLNLNQIEKKVNYHSNNINCIKHYRNNNKDYIISASDKVVIMVDFEPLLEINTDLGNIWNTEMVFHEDTFSVLASTFNSWDVKIYDSQGIYLNKFNRGQVRFINTYNDGTDTYLLLSSAANVSAFKLGTYDQPVKVFQLPQEYSLCNPIVINFKDTPTLYVCNFDSFYEQGTLFMWEFHTAKFIKSYSCCSPLFNFISWTDNLLVTANHNGNISIFDKDLTASPFKENIKAYEDDRTCSIIGINNSSKDYFLTASINSMNIKLWKKK